MPPIVRRLAIIAAVDGLLLQPLHQRSQRGLKVEYGSSELSPTTIHNGSGAVLLECHGLIGFLTVPPSTYLVAISGRRQVAQIRGAPIYVITDVIFIPTASHSDAEKAIIEAKEGLKRQSGDQLAVQSESDFSEDEEESRPQDSEHDENESRVSSDSQLEQISQQKQSQDVNKNSSGVAEDVIGKRGQYGRFADRWFSRKGWTADRRKSQGMSEYAKTSEQPSTGLVSGSAALLSNAASVPGTVATKVGLLSDSTDSGSAGISPITNTLLPKLLRTSRLLLTSESFFFSYDMDITRRMGTLPPKATDISLHRSVDPLYFWNRHISRPFAEAGHHGFVLPIMQGFVGQRAFNIDEKEPPLGSGQSVATSEATPVENEPGKIESQDGQAKFLITLISRRSIKRPGLRYLRRGVDDEGNVANSVETEQILSKEDWSGRVFSFTQIRGSMPLFFSQSPYSFKPVPVLQHSAARNEAAFQRHFQDIQARYGQIQICLLVDKSGGEAAIGQRYESNTMQFNEKASDERTRLRFEWFDFHNICRGMKFENVSLLMDKIGSSLDDFGVTEQVDTLVEKTQKGVVRTNCMDCLDRTNVVQSACGQRALEGQLREEGYAIDLKKDLTTQWFNTLWADNGDAISKQYSSTAALKGDYTRTRQRNYRGAINDLSLTLSRYYNNIVNDFFSQCTIDFLLGYVNSQVFEEFEDKLMSADPGMSIQKVHQNAINTCTKIVIEDGSEDLIGGWIMLSPNRPDVLNTLPMDESVLLLTDSALYRVRFDWNDEKVISFERVDLRSILSISKGPYVTSTHTPAQVNEERNFGFVIRYRPGKEDVARINTRSLSTAIGIEQGAEGGIARGAQGTKPEESGPNKILAFKALPAHSSSTLNTADTHIMSERETVSHVCEEIQRAANGGVETGPNLIEDIAIISAQEARKNTGLVDQLGHALKRFVWG